MIIRQISLTILSAVLSVLVFAPFDQPVLALISWVPFLWALHTCTSRSAFYLGLLHGLLLYGTTLSWMWGLFGSFSIALWGMLALYSAGFAMIVQKFHRRSYLLAALISMSWVGLEYFRSELSPLDFPWITPGTGFPPNLLTPIIGVYGVSFLIIFTGILLIQKRKIGVFLLALLGASLWPIAPSTDSTPLTVGLIQNESGYDESYYEDSQSLLAEVDLLVWPEYALGSYQKIPESVTKSLTQQVKLLVAGGIEQDQDDSRKSYNTAFTFSEKGLLGRHVKNHPVPLFSDGEPGKTALPIATEFGKIGTPICFDCDHQNVIRKMTQAGAETFLIPSMDAESWSARQHEQHGQLFRHRAAENGRWLAIASTSGVTQIINNRGQTVKRLPVMEEGTLKGEIYRLTHRTPFQLVGWLIGPFCFIGLIIGTLFLIVRAAKAASIKKR